MRLGSALRSRQAASECFFDGLFHVRFQVQTFQRNPAEDDCFAPDPRDLGPMFDVAGIGREDDIGPLGGFLVYTRRGADNDHVFRHRAPLFIAQVDPKRLDVIRASERKPVRSDHLRKARQRHQYLRGQDQVEPPQQAGPKQAGRVIAGRLEMLITG